MRFRGVSFTTFLLATCLTVYAVPPAGAQTAAPATPAGPPASPPAAQGTTTAPAATPAAPAAPPPGLWISGIHFGLQIEGGFTINPQTPEDGVNFGRLFDDRANQPQLNQMLVTINKPTDPNATGFDWGFKLQGMYGSDARYTHFLGVFDQAPGPGYENQFDVVEADVLLHLPFPTAGGMDAHVGLYPTPLGYEVIDPSANPFYSHSYLFNFGVPLKHTGILTTSHITPMVDLYLGVDTGSNTTFSTGTGDENSAVAGIFGFGLNLLGGNLTVLALSHIGPENSTRLLSPLGFNADGYFRYYNDIVVTWKATDKLTLTTELNLVRDDFDGFFVGKSKPTPVNAFGVAQYISYPLSDTVTFNARGEIYRDDSGFFVTAFPNNIGLMNNNFVGGELGLPGATSVGAGRPTTYGEITIGLTFKPSLPAPITGLLIRPELRVDDALNGTHAFGSNF
ncbi:MAG TPA: outer membrane beta-barrel protein, partial [Rhodopila sp.]